MGGNEGPHIEVEIFYNLFFPLEKGIHLGIPWFVMIPLSLNSLQVSLSYLVFPLRVF